MKLNNNNKKTPPCPPGQLYLLFLFPSFLPFNIYLYLKGRFEKERDDLPSIGSLSGCLERLELS